ncbi:hypothetical protein THAOC_12204 [Thalassiosira oceanica]|uniref:Uncharacterized protein n=1 Tax=Thalassiosira oceanica TaxID=159749 RepID=K0SKL7_THAOC|nr:hypothetical protein THAOC_12204 [Thalassiosira oceanica]|eukprot:EJK66833.1 hypothetical protein THAOC_12204 [Thalassiosira oceanica]
MWPNSDSPPSNVDSSVDLRYGDVRYSCVAPRLATPHFDILGRADCVCIVPRRLSHYLVGYPSGIPRPMWATGSCEDPAAAGHLTFPRVAPVPRRGNLPSAPLVAPGLSKDPKDHFFDSLAPLHTLVDVLLHPPTYHCAAQHEQENKAGSLHPYSSSLIRGWLVGYQDLQPNKDNVAGLLKFVVLRPWSKPSQNPGSLKSKETRSENSWAGQQEALASLVLCSKSTLQQRFEFR